MPYRPLLSCAVLLATASPAAAAPRVVADIAPSHAIVARVMEGVGEPTLLLPPGTSPHAYALRPSEARALQAADLVFWIGPALTPWMEEPLAALAGDATTIGFLDAPGLALLPVRDGGGFDAHAAEEAHDHGGSDTDPHVWLDPANGRLMAATAAEALAAADPANAETYRANAAAFAAEMAALTGEIDRRLDPVRDARFVVFHDAYRYFEARFDMPATGSLALSDADRPGAARVREIRDRIREADVACIFAEPQFAPALIATVTEGTDARSATLDPLGTRHAPGPSLYPDLLRDLAEGLAGCLGGAS